MSVSSRPTWGQKKTHSDSQESVTLKFTVGVGVDMPGENHITEATIKPPTLGQLYRTLQKFGYDVCKIELRYQWMPRLPYFKELCMYDFSQDVFNPRVRHVNILKFRDDFAERKTAKCEICKTCTIIKVKRQTRTRYQSATEDYRCEKNNICKTCFGKSRNLIYKKLRTKPETILHYRSKFDKAAKEVQWLERK